MSQTIFGEFFDYVKKTDVIDRMSQQDPGDFLTDLLTTNKKDIDPMFAIKITSELECKSDPKNKNSTNIINNFISQKYFDTFGQKTSVVIDDVASCDGKQATQYTTYSIENSTKVIWVDTIRSGSAPIEINKSKIKNFVLFAVIYGGHLTESSHYIALIKSKDDWYIHDDNEVKKYNEFAKNDTTLPADLEGLNKRYLFYIRSDDMDSLPKKNQIGFGQKGDSCWFASILKVLLNLPSFKPYLNESATTGGSVKKKRRTKKKHTNKKLTGTRKR